MDVMPELWLPPALAAGIPQSQVRDLQNFHCCRSRHENEQMDTLVYQEDLFNIDNASFGTHRIFEIKGIMLNHV